MFRIAPSLRHPEVAAKRPSKDARPRWGCSFTYCADGSYYVGGATGEDLTKRVAEHERGAYPGYTYLRRPVALVWSEHFQRITDAITAERQIKGWSRAKKDALIKGNWDAVRLLARRRAGRPWKQ